MTYVAEFTIPPESFPFGETLVAMPGVEIEVDQIVPTDESALPFFWVRGCDPEEFLEAAEAEDDVEDTRALETVGETALFRARWKPSAGVIEGLQDLDATIVESVGTAESWRFEVRTADRAAFNRFRDVFEAEGIEVDLTRIYDLGDVVDGERNALTDDQRETLLAAYQAGYYETPRETTQAELGERFGITSRAVSDRLRRGTRNLIRGALLSRDGD